MLSEFQQAFADLVSSPNLCREVRERPNVLRERYRLDDREARRLLGIVTHPRMAANCTLYRANRLAPLALNLPNLLRALGPDLRHVLDAFWQEHPRTDVHFYVESYRFCEFVRTELERGRRLGPDVARALERDAMTVADRLEASHTEIYSPLRTPFTRAVDQ
jgi:hypothetical protein